MRDSHSPTPDLVARVCEASPSATTEKVDKLLTELWEQTFLLTDLRPPLTSEDPARYVADRLRPLSEASEISSRLDAFLMDASAWDRLPPRDGADAFGRLLTHAGALPDGSGGLPVQVDMAMAVDGRLGHAVAVEASRAAELLLRLSPSPRGLSSIASYRQAFLNRYGHSREVPLLELFDPVRGLGPPPTHGHVAVGPEPAKAADRAQTLLQLACAALHDRARTIVLDEQCLGRLETWRPDPRTAPLSLDINILVAARSRTAIDAGDFTVVVGPNLGAWAAGRNLGRFADLLAPEGPEALKRTATAVRAHSPDDLWVELIYLPSNLRSANVVIRPAVHSHEVALGVAAGVPASCVVGLDELVVGVERGRFQLRWPAADKRVVFTSGHMLNNVNAPAVARFLVDVSHDAKAGFSAFDWGPAEPFPYLPRVQVGRVVLRPAQWRLRKEDWPADSPDAFRRTLDRWRAEWDVSRHVCVSVGDNRLVIDLDRGAQAAELRSELRQLPNGAAMVVQEVLPALDEAWLPGPDGDYCSEFIVSVVLRGTQSPARAGEAGLGVEEVPSGSMVEPVAAAPSGASASLLDAGVVQRYYPPGSEWLFVKLYCPRHLEEDVIGHSMLTFGENVVAAGLADSWFFIRYSDPDPHLRLRFHGTPEQLTTRLFGPVCDWASGLVSTGLCARFTFETYEQEVERFGGVAGMVAAEAVFAADSRAAAKLLRATRDAAWPHDRTSLLALSVDDLVAGIGFDEAERLRWYRRQTTIGARDSGLETRDSEADARDGVEAHKKESRAKDPDIGAEYRQRKNVLRSLLGHPHAQLEAQVGGLEIAAALAERRAFLSAAARDLRTLAEQRTLRQTLSTLCASFVHLHVNRLGGLDSGPEHRLLGLLLRTRESLEKAPATK